MVLVDLDFVGQAGGHPRPAAQKVVPEKVVDRPQVELVMAAVAAVAVEKASETVLAVVVGQHLAAAFSAAQAPANAELVVYQTRLRVPLPAKRTEELLWREQGQAHLECLDTAPFENLQLAQGLVYEVAD